MFRYVLFLLSLLIFALAPQAAQYDPQIKWSYIDTPYNRIIFPEEMVEEGLRVAALTEQVNPLISETMSPLYPYNYPIILSGNDMTSNGYVTIYPRRSVWYSLNPGTSSGTTEWYDHLAIHEGRHTMQFDRLNSSTGHLLFLLGGESWYGLTIGCAPTWMFEGDAIMCETFYSASGRGRLGSYFELMRSLALEEDFSYYKMHHLSYRDITPGGHALGYPFMYWLEENYGPKAAEDLFSRQAELPLPLIGTTRALKKLTGLTPSQAYQEMMADLKEESEALIAAKGPLVEGEKISPEQKIYTAYSHLFVDGNQWYAQKSDLLEPSALYRYAGGTEEKLFEPVPATALDGKRGTVLWDSVRTSLSWTTREEADLYLKTADKGKIRLTEGGRYYQPTLSSEGDRIAVLELTLDHKPRLVIMNKRGEILQQADFPEEISYASWPAWDGDSLVLLVQNRQGEALWRYKEGSFTPLTPFTVEDLGSPEPWEGGVFLTLNRYEGQEICYLKEGVLTRVTNTPLGADVPVVDRINGRLLYIYREGTLGDSIRSLPLDSASWDGRRVNLEAVPPLPIPELAGFAEESDHDYEVKEYRPLEFFSPIGWGLTSNNLDTDDLEIPFTLVSYDSMQTLSWEGGLYYNINEETLGYGLETELSLFLPHITSEMKLEKRIRDDETYHDLYTTAGLSLPLGYSRGRDTFSLDLSGEAYYLTTWSDSEQSDWIGFLEEFEATHSRDGGYRSLQSRFEESLNFSLLHSIDPAELHRLSTWAYVLFPGLYPSHGSGLYAYYEENPSLLTSEVPNVRGWDYDGVEEQIMVKAEYVLPLFYPDLSLGGLTYTPRISAELFLDRQWSGDNWEETATSSGCELLLDSYFFSLPVQIQWGFRYSWLWETEEPAFEIVLKGYSISS
ncbi:MAG: hypothetical protein PQJ60_02205 [Spirochaetales bacterium]|nr:hypothetical protein [Spirochaetales bacterium]